jgi:hypothetical protein
LHVSVAEQCSSKQFGHSIFIELSLYLPLVPNVISLLTQAVQCPSNVMWELR